MLCNYNCGQKATHQFKNGKWCCSKNQTQCPSIKKKKENLIPWNKGLKNCFSKESIEKMKKSSKNKFHSEETKQKIRELNKGNIPWNKGLKNCYNEDTLEKMGKYTIDLIKKKYPTFAKIEEMRYNPNKPGEKEIQVHCKNHKCPYSKEQDGWFTPIRESILGRINAIENNDGNYFLYCSKHCKDNCFLYGKSIIELINIDKRKAGILKEQLYTSEEYQTFRQQVLKRENYLCEYCEQLASHVHHSRPQKLEPGFVLDPDFGIACCEKCHYKYGHKDECSTGNLATKVCI